MKVIDLIKLTSKLLNEIDVKNVVKYCEDNQLSIDELFALETRPDCLTSSAEKELRVILDCINIARILIATEKDLLFHEEQIVVSNGEFNIDTLSQKLYKIKEITLNDIKQKIVLMDNKIKLADGKYKIKYAFLPADLSFDGIVETHGGKLSILALCYGICSQYCLIKNIYEEQEMWQKKFDEATKICFRKIGEVKIKSRRWL